MYLRKCLSLAGFSVLLPTVVLLFLTSAGAQIRYRVVQTPSQLGAKAFVDLNEINKKGVIAGTRRKTGVPSRGFVWYKDSLQFLPGLGGACSHANSINDSGHAAGSACLPGDIVLHAALWVNKQVTDIEAFGGIGSSVHQVNNVDQAAGSYWFEDGSERGFLWENGDWTDFGGLGGSATYPEGLNDAGVVTGHSDLSNDPDPRFGIPPFHGFQWSSGVLTDFGSIFGADFNFGSGIDTTGKIIGTSDLAGDDFAHAFLWDHGTVQDLSTLPGDQVSWGMGINDRGQMVGASGLRDVDPLDGPPVYTMLCPCHAVLWQNGKIIDLNTAVSPHWSLIDATDISDRGVILAIGSKDGGRSVRIVLEPIQGTESAVASTTLGQTRRRDSRLANSGPKRIRRDGRGGIVLER